MKLRNISRLKGYLSTSDKQLFIIEEKTVASVFSFFIYLYNFFFSDYEQ